MLLLICRVLLVVFVLVSLGFTLTMSIANLVWGIPFSDLGLFLAGSSVVTLMSIVLKGKSNGETREG